MEPTRESYLTIEPLFDNGLLNSCGDRNNTAKLIEVFDNVTRLMMLNSPFNQRFPRILRQVALNYQNGDPLAREHFSDPSHVRFMLTDVLEFLDSKKAKQEI
ncbi:MAG: hypothetical protein HQL67_04470 [Magnetococcales bacterium]|nr:hypothetical protein [Magnetococcales bacterium]